MYMNGFSVRIPQGKEQNGYVLLKHDTVYTLRLRNARAVSCDAKVEIDGHSIGCWKIKPKDSIELEHPVNDDGRFTFYKLDSKERFSTQLVRTDPNLGLVRVIFTPELVDENTLIRGFLRRIQAPPRQDQYVWVDGCDTGSFDVCEPTWTYSGDTYTISNVTYAVQSSNLDRPIMFCSMGSQHVGAGGTGLSGESDQEYELEEPSESPDLEQQTVIQLRLIERTGKEGVRPLISSNSTPYPPPIIKGGGSMRKLNIVKK